MPKKFHYFIFFVLSILLLTGINEYLSVVTEQKEFFSVVILLLVFSLNTTRFLGKKKVLIRVKDTIQLTYVWSVISFLIIGLTIDWTSENGSAAIWGIRYYGPGLLIFLVFYHSIQKLRREDGMDTLIRLFRNIMLVNAILAVSDYISGGRLELFQIGDRFSGLITNPNDAGFSFNVLLILNFYFFQINRRWVDFIGIIISLMAVFVTFSKTAIITALVVLLLILMKEFKKGSAKLRVKIIVLGLSLLPFWGFVKSFTDDLETEQFNRILQITEVFSGKIDTETTTKRTDIFTEAIDKIENKWLFGQGIGSFSKIESIEVGVHNQYVLILGESGLIPLIIFLTFLVKLMQLKLKKGIQGLETNRLLTFSFFMYCFTNHNIFFSKFIILIIALIVVQAQVVKQNAKRNIFLV